MKRFLILAVLLLGAFLLCAENMTLEEFEQSIFASINARRVENGLRPLAYEAGLARLARSHSKNMGSGGFFDHVDQEGLQVLQRQQKYYPELIHAGIGENLYLFERGSRKFDPNLIVRGWMESSGHRANILHKDYTHTGIGIFLIGNQLYTTQIFAAPVLKLVSPLPPKFQRNRSYELEFEYLSPLARESFQCLLATPDPEELVEVTPFMFYKGTAPVEPDWKDNNHLSLPLEFDHGKGEYSLQLGWDGNFYAEMMVFKVK